MRMRIDTSILQRALAKVRIIFSRLRGEMDNREDIEFMGELKAAVKRKPRFSANLLFFTIIGFVLWAIWWAYQAPLDEVTMGHGKVIPSSQVQKIQNLEGGILSELRVREGEIVRKGQILLVIDDTQFKSKVGEERVQKETLLAMIARLAAEATGNEISFPDELAANEPVLVANETALFHARRAELESNIKVLGHQKEQKSQELKELRTRVEQLRKNLALARKELRITRAVLAENAISEIDLIRVQREVTGIESDLLSARQTIPRIQSAVSELEEQIKERQSAFIAKAQTELRETEAKLRSLAETMTASADRLTRTEVTSPVTGVVKRILVHTVGGVIKPGMDLMEIVPQDDTLLVEANIKPADVAFLHPGQSAKVKITAYDYAVYGSLDASLEHISADTIMDEQSRENYYLIHVRTQQNFLTHEGRRLPIIPGMIAEVDILTGKRTVLEYLLKPILRARQKAMRER
uniref:Membrane fusion protein (MFP) family protein n=1 Tax=Candidatus Kentrum sp. DK TaxID=2126562 RepID=A0A450TK66_9GAMM|nr:MAG: membrane fusion protein, adhesin transport system [Candidatus Kentron sp. DK]